MLRNKNSAIAIVVVEGSSDSRVYRKVLRDQDIHIAWLNGKENALELLDQLRNARMPGVVGIIDADELRFLGRRKQAPNVCWTSQCDLESMVIASDAYLRTPVPAITEDLRKEHRANLISAAVPIGCLRILSKTESWALDFKALTFGSFIDSARISCDLDACCEEVLAKNLQARLDRRELSTKVRDMSDRISDPFLIVNGHDVCRIAHLCSLRLFKRSIRDAAQTFTTIVENYGPIDFEATSTYTELRDWEVSMGKYSVTITRI